MQGMHMKPQAGMKEVVSNKDPIHGRRTTRERYSYELIASVFKASRQVHEQSIVLRSTIESELVTNVTDRFVQLGLTRSAQNPGTENQERRTMECRKRNLSTGFEIQHKSRNGPICKYSSLPW